MNVILSSLNRDMNWCNVSVGSKEVNSAVLNVKAGVQMCILPFVTVSVSVASSYFVSSKLRIREWANTKFLSK